MSSEENLPEAWFGRYEGDVVAEAEENLERAAVYFLIALDEITYIGCSVQPYGRIREHASEGRIPFDRYTLVWFDEQESAAVAEYEAIQLFDPPMNAHRAPSHVNAQYNGKKVRDIITEKMNERLRNGDIHGAARVLGRS